MRALLLAAVHRACRGHGRVDRPATALQTGLFVALSAALWTDVVCPHQRLTASAVSLVMTDALVGYHAAIPAVVAETAGLITEREALRLDFTGLEPGALVGPDRDDGSSVAAADLARALEPVGDPHIPDDYDQRGSRRRRFRRYHGVVLPPFLQMTPEEIFVRPLESRQYNTKMTFLSS